MMERTASIKRDTKETRIALTLSLDGTGSADIDTGIGFFDHMLDGFSRHGFFDLSVKVDGDLFVDGHHTVEDTGIVLGQAIAEAVGDKKELNVTDIFCCRWMTRWLRAQWICADVPISILITNLMFR